MFLLARSEVEHFFCIFDQNSAFGLSLGDVQCRSKDSNFGLVDFPYITFEPFIRILEHG